MYELHFDGLLVATAHTERMIFAARRTLTEEATGPAANFRAYTVAYPAGHLFPMSDGTFATAEALGLPTTTPEV